MRHSKSRPNAVASSIREWLKRHGLSKEIEQLAAVTRLWERSAGGQWRQVSWVERWDGTALTVGVSSPGVATRLRFEHDELLASLQRDGLTEVRELRAVVRPKEVRRPLRRHRRYSPGGAVRMAESAEEIADPELREALLRLAGRLNAPPEDGEGQGG
ncbi:DciA family protein [Thiohalorhabdus methylotrophus]|uniref:DciA family protein n=1 Tax=Thiohalorhabdus methylotrophus TaxID=3242694 RepID=A0ABV4TXY4_9GAMM